VTADFLKGYRMRRLFWFLCLIGMRFIVLAQPKKSKKERKDYKPEFTYTKSGFRYKLFPFGNTTTIDQGDLVYFEMQVMHQDSLIEDSRLHFIRPEIVIPGKAEDMSGTAVVEGLTMMHAGDSLIVYEPVEQVNDLPEVMKNWKEVNYRLKVVEVIKQSDLENVKRRESQVATLIQQDLQKYKNQQFERIIQTQSGLTILIHQDGEGEKFVEGDVARILFYAIETKEGKYFDGTFDTGVPFKLVVGSQRIIEGLGEAVSLLRRGAKVSAYIPSKLAYGSTGVFEKLEPDTDLLFYIEILN